MFHRVRLSIFSLALCVCAALVFVPGAPGQQTLGGITGTVTDTSGGVLADTSVTLVSDQTTLTRTQKTNSSGSYEFANLPIGTYTLTFSHDGFETQKIPSILVQADRTVSLNPALKVGQVGTTITVEETPLLNAVDTTNGYVLDKAQLEAIPLPTGSFTGLAILSPGVSAELPAGTGANAGLGNQPIWANGQRDTSNTFLLNGVDAKSLFNGKSTSQVASARIVNNTGVSGAASGNGGVIQSTASPYLAVGQSLPTPAPETIQEVRVNTSMYDAQQGSTSGAHIDMSTASGSNAIHGSAYAHRGTNAMNAAPFFFNQDPNIPADEKNPELHRYTAGGTVGAPIIKNKLFGYLSYQHVHSSDQEIGIGRATVPFDFTANGNAADGVPACGATRATATLAPCLAAISNNSFFSTLDGTVGTGPNQISPIALAMFQYKLPNGQFLVPWNDGHVPTINFPENALIPGTAYFIADQAVSNLDWIVNSKDTLALKYYYQHDPSVVPYAYSTVPGFTQRLDAGSQVASITNTQTLTPNLSVAEVFGYIREKIFSTIGQPFTPAQFASFVESSTGATPAQSTINTFGSNFFPGISIVNMLGYGANNDGCAPTDTACIPTPVNESPMTIGQGAASQGANTGIFQNRFMPSANAIWNHGKHTVSFGGTYSYTQLNTIDLRPGTGMIGTADLSQFLQGFVTPYTTDGYVTTNVLQGNANRYLRANEWGLYVQDKFQFRPNLSFTVGLRFDDDGGMSEKYGRLYNFDPADYDYDPTSDTLVSNGIIVAGNNKQFASKGVSPSTLTGRQWGLAPRLGVAWSPGRFSNKLVVRAGWGLYYDRGELFTYLSPGFAAGVVTGGPFGVNQAPPFVSAQECTASTFYQDYIPTCDPGTYGLTNPFGTTLGPPPSGNPASINNYIPNTGVPGVGIAAGILDGQPLFPFGVYNRKNKLPYTMNQTLDIQWQPRRDLAIDVGYVGNFGRHEVIPVPFNQAQIASPTNPALKGTPFQQNYTYGYTVQGPAGCTVCAPITLPDGTTMLNNYEGGNADLRVPFIGYSSEALSYTAAGVSAYNALQVHVEKRMNHGLQLGFSYTYSHALDEQSAMGLFYNGNNPLDLHSGYGNSDFDRTHVINFSYLYQFPNKFGESSWKGKIADGWAIEGIGVFQSGQPYSIIDYTGAVGSIFYGVNDGITNPIVPLAPGCTPKNALTGVSGAFGTPDNPQYALKSQCFTLPLLAPGDLNGAIPPGDTFETNFTTGQRNIFRQAWQKRADVSIVKNTQITERVNLKYSFDVFNLTNSPSFDIPLDDVSQNQFYSNVPVEGTPALPNSCPNSTNGSFYNCPFGLGIVNKTIGSPRQIQMSLSLQF
jgi:Carboxypeptidase regulatory-like domain/TonB dependent receptor